jgi:hypothetical protein
MLEEAGIQYQILRMFNPSVNVENDVTVELHLNRSLWFVMYD